MANIYQFRLAFGICLILQYKVFFNYLLEHKLIDEIHYSFDEEVIQKSGEKITIGHITYYYDKDSKILYTDKTLRKAICKYDRLTCVLSPL